MLPSFPTQSQRLQGHLNLADAVPARGPTNHFPLSLALLSSSHVTLAPSELSLEKGVTAAM